MSFRFEEIEEYLNERPKFNQEITMEKRRELYRRIGAPLEGKTVIHVAGTNGKGSVCSFLRCGLEAAGFHTATFISPHLLDIRERFLMDGEMVSKKSLLDAYEKLLAAAEGMDLVYFDCVFFLFLLLSEIQKVDVVILETGLGGRLDTTNLVEHKSLCIITEIGMDHMAQLGDTIPEIAAEKAGIMRSGVPVVFRAGTGESFVITDKARELGLTDKELYPLLPENVQDVNIRDNFIDFSLVNVYYKLVRLSLQTSAPYQIENAHLALLGLQALAERGMNIPLDAVQEGFSHMHWEARMDEILPGVFLDGAHNEDGIKSFIASVRCIRSFRRGKATLLFGVMKDKNFAKMITMLRESDLFDEIIFTSPHGARSAGREEYEAVYPGCHYEEDAAKLFREQVRKCGDALLFIAGSLYLAGELLEIKNAEF